MDFTIGTGYDRCAMVNVNELSDQFHQRVQTAAALQSQRQTMEPFKPSPQGAVHSAALGHMYANESASGRAWRSEEDTSSYELNKIKHTAPPGLVAPDVPSRGSFGHPIYCGPPCKYAGRSKGCRDCNTCLSCHVCKWTRRTHGLRGHERLLEEDEENSQANEAPDETDFEDSHRAQLCGDAPYLPNPNQQLVHLNTEQATMAQGTPTWGLPKMPTNKQAGGYPPQIFQALDRYDMQIDPKAVEDCLSVNLSNLGKILAQFPVTPPTEPEEGSCHSSDEELSFTGGDALIQWPQQPIQFRL